jgi:hypothetical protein
MVFTVELIGGANVLINAPVVALNAAMRLRMRPFTAVNCPPT